MAAFGYKMNLDRKSLIKTSEFVIEIVKIELIKKHNFIISKDICTINLLLTAPCFNKTDALLSPPHEKREKSNLCVRHKTVYFFSLS